MNTLALAPLLCAAKYSSCPTASQQVNKEVSGSKFSMGGKSRKNIVRYTNATDRNKGAQTI